MLDVNDFKEKKIIIVYPKDGDKLCIKNDNFIIQDSNNKIKLQISCYRIFLIYVIGGFSITSGLIEKSKKFGFSIVLYTLGFKPYQIINFEMQGNTLLRKKQYTTIMSNDIARYIIINKIENQIFMLKKIRTCDKEIIKKLNKYLLNLNKSQLSISEIMGIEGSAAKIYFKQMFSGCEWNGRQPRVKRDRINLLLDIGYTVLFNYLDSILKIYGFDTYKGNLHQEFYKRKSLVCDMIEPFRSIVDYKIRKSLNLGQLNYSYIFNNGHYDLKWKDSEKFIKLILEEVNSYSICIFKYIRDYYRWFMKQDKIINFEKVELIKNDSNKL